MKKEHCDRGWLAAVRLRRHREQDAERADQGWKKSFIQTEHHFESAWTTGNATLPSTGRSLATTSRSRLRAWWSRLACRGTTVVNKKDCHIALQQAGSRQREQYVQRDDQCWPKTGLHHRDREGLQEPDAGAKRSWWSQDVLIKALLNMLCLLRGETPIPSDRLSIVFFGIHGCSSLACAPPVTLCSTVCAISILVWRVFKFRQKLCGDKWSLLRPRGSCVHDRNPRNCG